MPAKDLENSAKPTASELRARLRAKGLPAVLGKTLTRADNPSIDPSSLAAPGVHDIVGAEFPDYASALFFALKQAVQSKAQHPILICETESLAYDYGALYAPGLAWFGIDPSGLIIIRTKSDSDLLWSAEEALGCGELAAVIIRLPARGGKYSFAASRRLQLRALESRTRAFVVRARQERNATSAETLWRIGAAPSILVGNVSKKILGRARWRVVLERARTSQPREWVVDFGHATHRIDMAKTLGDRPLFSRAS
jgi:protein ImuA